MTGRIFPSFTWRLSVSGNIVFLTFDDGPHPDITPFVLDELEKHGMKATFFCVGENLVRYPAIAERIIAEGHRIGNHTMRHNNGHKTPDDLYLDSVREFEQVCQTSIFRPPYGRIRKSQGKQLAATHSVIMWSLLTYDYDLNVNERKIVRKASKAKPGDIIVLHDNPRIAVRMRSLLPAFLEELKKKGYTSEVIPPSL